MIASSFGLQLLAAMKDLKYVLSTLSTNEIKSFRKFLKDKSPKGINKRIWLLDKISKSKSAFPGKDEKNETDSGDNTSRQATYQLKKRLREDFYSFIITQSKFSGSHTDLGPDSEMQCLKKLYCFKVLIKRHLFHEAKNLLSEIYDIANRHHLDGISIQTELIADRYFHDFPRTNLKFDRTMKRLRHNHRVYDYVNNYLEESISFKHTDDRSFRQSLNKASLQDGSVEGDSTVDELLKINDSFFQNDYINAHKITYRLKLALQETPQGESSTFDGIVLLELAKAYLCLGKHFKAVKCLNKAKVLFKDHTTGRLVVWELYLMACVRDGNVVLVEKAIKEIQKIASDLKDPDYGIRTQLFRAYLSFMKDDHRQVIKLANSYKSSSKSSSWIINLKFLELISILFMGDFIWLEYKMESFRKKVASADGDWKRLLDFVHYIKTELCYDQVPISDQTRSSISKLLIHMDSWHPLGPSAIQRTKK